jgi:hypothetical protein
VQCWFQSCWCQHFRRVAKSWWYSISPHSYCWRTELYTQTNGPHVLWIAKFADFLLSGNKSVAKCLKAHVLASWHSLYRYVRMWWKYFLYNKKIDCLDIQNWMFCLPFFLELKWFCHRFGSEGMTESMIHSLIQTVLTSDNKKILKTVYTIYTPI